MLIFIFHVGFIVEGATVHINGLRELQIIQGLIDGITELTSKKKEDEEPQSELKRVDVIKCIQFEKVRLRGVNLSGLDLSKLVNIFRVS